MKLSYVAPLLFSYRSRSFPLVRGTTRISVCPFVLLCSLVRRHYFRAHTRLESPRIPHARIPVPSLPSAAVIFFANCEHGPEKRSHGIFTAWTSPIFPFVRHLSHADTTNGRGASSLSSLSSRPGRVALGRSSRYQQLLPFLPLLLVRIVFLRHHVCSLLPSDSRQPR